MLSPSFYPDVLLWLTFMIGPWTTRSPCSWSDLPWVWRSLGHADAPTTTTTATRVTSYKLQWQLIYVAADRWAGTSVLFSSRAHTPASISTWLTHCPAASCKRAKVVWDGIWTVPSRCGIASASRRLWPRPQQPRGIVSAFTYLRVHVSSERELSSCKPENVSWIDDHVPFLQFYVEQFFNLCTCRSRIETWSRFKNESKKGVKVQLAALKQRTCKNVHFFCCNLHILCIKHILDLRHCHKVVASRDIAQCTTEFRKAICNIWLDPGTDSRKHALSLAVCWCRCPCCGRGSCIAQSSGYCRHSLGTRGGCSTQALYESDICNLMSRKWDKWSKKNRTTKNGGQIREEKMEHQTENRTLSHTLFGVAWFHLEASSSSSAGDKTSPWLYKTRKVRSINKMGEGR